MDSSNCFPFDSISAAITVAPKSIPVLGGIYKLATDIRETTERVAVNKHQCEQLSERIDTIIGFLAQRDFSNSLNDALHKALNRFERFLRECLEFISNFTETSWFKRIVNNKDHEKKFLDLNRELTQYSNDITFGIGLNNLPVNMKQDKNTINSNVDDQSNRMRKNDTSPERKTNANENAYYKQQEQVTNFCSGLWQYRYFQYNQWFGPFRHYLTFNPVAKTLTGHGHDNVGQYVLNGSFNEETAQMQISQRYQLGTGNPNLNLGHQDLIQVNWNSAKNMFEGMAYSQVGAGYVPGAIIEMWQS